MGVGVPWAVLWSGFFFFSSRRRHTRLTCDWSSDVCSSDLGLSEVETTTLEVQVTYETVDELWEPAIHVGGPGGPRSEERRVGKECRSRRSPYQQKKKRQAHLTRLLLRGPAALWPSSAPGYA